MIFGYATKRMHVSKAGKALAAYLNLHAKVATPRLQVAMDKFPHLAENLKKLTANLFSMFGPSSLGDEGHLRGFRDCMMAAVLRNLRDARDSQVEPGPCNDVAFKMITEEALNVGLNTRALYEMGDAIDEDVRVRNAQYQLEATRPTSQSDAVVQQLSASNASLQHEVKNLKQEVQNLKDDLTAAVSQVRNIVTSVHDHLVNAATTPPSATSPVRRQKRRRKGNAGTNEHRNANSPAETVVPEVVLNQEMEPARGEVVVEGAKRTLPTLPTLPAPPAVTQPATPAHTQHAAFPLQPRHIVPRQVDLTEYVEQFLF